MKTFNLAIVALAIAAAASTSAFASTLDSNGNIPVHESNSANSYGDVVSTPAGQAAKPTTLSNTDALILQLDAEKDYHNRH